MGTRKTSSITILFPFESVMSIKKESERQRAGLTKLFSMGFSHIDMYYYSTTTTTTTTTTFSSFSRDVVVG